MFNWFKKLKKKKQDEFLDKLYFYTLADILENLTELYNNTWDKERVGHIMRLVIGINIDTYVKDTELRKKTCKILQSGKKND